MISFCIALATLLIGYFVYGKFVERIFGIDPSRKTPAVANPDGVDFVPLPGWKIFMIQFLNIAGLGPIFGAIMGAKFGVSSFLWIVFGTIFAGAVHDFLAGMISLRHNGESLPETIGRYLGITAKQVMRCFTVILMILVGVVFVAGPADLLAMLTPEHLDSTFWIYVIFAYYILATMFPIDKIIGRIYPIFAVALINCSFTAPAVQFFCVRLALYSLYKPLCEQTFVIHIRNVRQSLALSRKFELLHGASDKFARIPHFALAVDFESERRIRVFRIL